jgi:cyclomaltodextrinase
VQLNLLGSHDTPRFKTLARGDNSAYRLATLFQMTCPGAPSIYYGDEIGLEGNHDPDCRRGFPWEEGRWDTELLADVQGCIALRQAHPALRRGDFVWLLAENGVVAYLRRLGSEAVLILLNNNHAPVTMDLPVEGHLAEGACVREAWSGVTMHVHGGQFQAVHVAARSGAVFVAEKEPGP